MARSGPTEKSTARTHGSPKTDRGRIELGPFPPPANEIDRALSANQATTILGEAQDLQRKYDWQKASGVYESLARGFEARGELERAALARGEEGLCHFRAAFQSQGEGGFAELVERSKSTYQSSIELHTRVGSPASLAHAALLKGEVAFVGSFVAETAEEKRRLLAESSGFKKDASAQFEKLGEEKAAVKATLSLLDSLLRELNLEWASERRLEIADQALQQGSKATRAATAGKEELAWAHYLLGVFAWRRVYLLQDTATRDRELTESLNHNSRAIELSEEVSDQRLLSLAHLAAISQAGVRGPPEASKLHLKAALDSALVTGDNEVIADALLANASDLAWEMASKEMPESRLADFEACKNLTEDAARRYGLVHSDEGLAACYAQGFAHAYDRLAFAEVDQAKRISLLEEAVKRGREALEEYRKSGTTREDSPAHMLMIVLSHLASNATSEEERKRLLNEASQMVAESLAHRESTTPFHSWNVGVALYYQAIIQAELSNFGLDPKQKVRALTTASKGVEDAIEHCREHFAPSYRIRQSVAVGLGTYASRLSDILEELFEMTNEQPVHDKLVSALKEAADFYEQGGWPSRAAEAHWKVAQSLDRQRRHTDASQEFETASGLYESAAKKTPEFRAYFGEYASYMKAWAEIDTARHHATLQRYDESAACYQRSSELLRGSTKWENLADHFAAWAKLEAAEALSATEDFSRAITEFKGARDLFAEVGARFDEQTTGRQAGEGPETPLQILEVSSVRKQYCEGREALDRARLHDLGDEVPQSAAQYGLAAKLFGRIAQSVQSVAERHEMSSMAQLCRGWQLMKEAEEPPSPSLYNEAAEIFAEAAGSGAGEKAESIASADSHFCRAMNSQLEFAKTGDQAIYSQAKTHLQVARNLYQGVGLQRAADWTEASMAVLDASLYSLQAETTVDQELRAKLYSSAENSLESAAALCEKAGYRSRKRLVERELKRLRERARVALNLAGVMTRAPTASPGSLVGMPAREEAKGLAEFEGVNIQARLRHETEVEVGEILKLQLDLFNAGKKPASLLRVEEILPKGLKPAVIPEPYLLEDSHLNTKGRVIEPLRIESFVITLKTEETGEFTMNPRLVYVDEAGRMTTQALEATMVKVLPEPVFEFKKDEGRAVFECLVEAFVEDYMRKRLSSEQSGWRSLIEIARSANVSRSSLYGKEGRQGPVFYELMSRGLIETRTFAGQRGRGGEVLRARIAYGRDSVRRYVDRRIMKPK